MRAISQQVLKLLFYIISFENYAFEITATSPKRQQVNKHYWPASSFYSYGVRCRQTSIAPLPWTARNYMGATRFLVLGWLKGTWNNQICIHFFFSMMLKGDPCLKEGKHSFSGITRPQWVNTLRPRPNGRHFADDIFKCIFFNENVWISINISLKFVSMGPINNFLALVQVMAWRRPGDKPLSKPMMISLLTHICVTRPQWAKAQIMKSISLCIKLTALFAPYISSYKETSILISKGMNWVRHHARTQIYPHT